MKIVAPSVSQVTEDRKICRASVQKVDTIHGACSSENPLAEDFDEPVITEALEPAQASDFNPFDHMVGHPRCVFINYIWLSIVEHN